MPLRRLTRFARRRLPHARTRAPTWQRSASPGARGSGAAAAALRAWCHPAPSFRAHKRLPARRRAAYAAVYLPGALRAGARCADLICIRYEEHVEEPLEAVRARWRIEPAPRRADALQLSARA